MAPKLAFFFVALLSLLCFAVSSQGENENSILCPGKEKVTHLHFFLYDILSGSDPMVLLVAKPNATVGPAETPFGQLFVTDDEIRDKPGGKLIGNAQGLYVSSSKKELTLVLITDFGFTSGPHAGSSFSVLSRNPISQDKRELAVVGGRGKFRMARGFALLDTYYFDHDNGDAIIEYNVTLYHY